MTLQLLDFCLSILTLCSSYMEVPTYLNFKSMNHMVSLGQGSIPARKLLPLSVTQCLGWVLRRGTWEKDSCMSDLYRESAQGDPERREESRLDTRRKVWTLGTALPQSRGSPGM